MQALQDVPFHYTNDGCFARAHALSGWLHDRGYHTGKIWIKGNLTDPNNPNTSWGYHVAAVLYVNVDDNIVPFVFDPSPQVKGPVSVDEWLKQNNVDKRPFLATFPLPKKIPNFLGYILAYSSHLPFYPYQVDMKKTIDDNILEARQKNQYYFEKSRQ